VNIKKSYALFSTVAAVATFALSVVVSTPSSAAGFPTEPQSRPPVNSGASGGANPGNSGGQGGYNPGNSGGQDGSGGQGGYNPGNGGGGYNPGHGGGYNPGYNGRRGSITVYRDANFRGASIRFDNDVPNLNNTGFNDAISSMRFQGAWEACSDAYFRGRCQIFVNDLRNLQNWGLNDRISSLRQVR
jgi:hypothetical protein